MKKYYFALVLTLFVLPFFAQNIPSYVPKDGLVGWWPFNGNANDESGNGNHGTVNGATLTTDRNGVANSAYSFNGINNQMKISNLNINEQDNAVNTVVFWMKWDGKNNAMPICWNYDYDLYFHNNNFGFNTYESNKLIGTSFNNEFINQNIFIVAEFINGIPDNKNCKLYINAVKQQLSGYATKFSKATKEINIGSGKIQTELQYSFSSLIDDIAIYNRALTEQEITTLYNGCSHEQANATFSNSLLLKTNQAIELSATPSGGSFNGDAVKNGKFEPAYAKMGLNKVQYNFKNSQGCNDSTIFTMIVADTVGSSCTKYDTVIVNKTNYDTVTVKNNVYDTVTITNNVTKYDTITVTNNITKYDTVIVKNNVFDTVTVTNNVTKYDTVTVKNNVYDTVVVNKYDTITVTKNVTKYDTVTVKNNVYDTVTVTNNITKYDTVIVKTNVFDTVKVNQTIYDTVLVNKYDTITVTNTVTKYDTITLTDTVSILKIKFKLTTGLQANQLASMSLYPNPTSDVLHIEIGDAKALEGYRYRILDALGKEVYNELVKNKLTEIPLKTLGAAGMYQLEVLDANKTSIQTNKIVLQ